MGTRGTFGFFFRGRFYVVYNHFDSYPQGLGAQIVAEIKNAIRSGDFASWLEKFQGLKIVSYAVPPTPEDAEKLASYSNFQVSHQNPTDWYCLTHKCQFSLVQVLESGYLLNHVDDNGVPMWQEYAYIVNFDSNELDYYEGSELAASYDFNDLPDWGPEPEPLPDFSAIRNVTDLCAFLQFGAIPTPKPKQDYSALTTRDLRFRLREKNLPFSGTRAELINRLEAAV